MSYRSAWTAYCDTVWRNVLVDKAIGTNNDIITDGYPFGDSALVANPNI